MHFSTIIPSLFAALAAATPSGMAEGRILHKRDRYSNNWCGQVLSGSNFTEVDATWVMPKSTPTKTNYANQPIYNYQWVGFDGASSNCQTILQAGTYYTLTNNQPAYGFWYEFYPRGSWLLTEPAVNPGDSVYVKVTATSTTTGNVYMKNLSTGKDFSYDMEAPSGSQLCQSTAEWIQDNSGGDPNTFAPFSTFSFTKAHASDASGANYGLTGSERWIMEPGTKALCTTSALTSNSVKISYTGPTN
ncbi:hypothetical protein VHEMI09701 [[Torrubiella] hemipterigena]|uniref:Concanavalin A-like lectin/glucanase n=1 Tax=[Torrubiella] hemipterigena TaxID=1531966 RepID=A0A0A1TS09_9HYPO|nr:hypothetical protein VHEMI09701 [[Torrubiella] hemipterigena]